MTFNVNASSDPALWVDNAMSPFVGKTLRMTGIQIIKRNAFNSLIEQSVKHGNVSWVRLQHPPVITSCACPLTRSLTRSAPTTHPSAPASLSNSFVPLPYHSLHLQTFEEGHPGTVSDYVEHINGKLTGSGRNAAWITRTSWLENDHKQLFGFKVKDDWGFVNATTATKTTLVMKYKSYLKGEFIMTWELPANLAGGNLRGNTMMGNAIMAEQAAAVQAKVADNIYYRIDGTTCVDVRLDSTVGGICTTSLAEKTLLEFGAFVKLGNKLAAGSCASQGYTKVAKSESQSAGPCGTINFQTYTKATKIVVTQELAMAEQAAAVQAKVADNIYYRIATWWASGPAGVYKFYKGTTCVDVRLDSTVGGICTTSLAEETLLEFGGYVELAKLAAGSCASQGYTKVGGESYSQNAGPCGTINTQTYTKATAR